MALPDKSKLGKTDYINPNCWTAKAIGGPPYERCKYCTLKAYRECPIFKYLIITVVLIFLSLTSALLIDRKLWGSFFKVILFTDLIFSIAYGFYFQKMTIKTVKKDYETKEILEQKIKERTKELEGLTGVLDKKVKEKTEELEEKVKALERFKRLTIGRELKMVDLKRKISEMEEEAKEETEEKTEE